MASTQAFVAAHKVCLVSCCVCNQPVQDAPLGTVCKLSNCHHVAHQLCLDTTHDKCPKCQAPMSNDSIVQTDNLNCTICLNPIHLYRRDIIKLPSCPHVFHKKCIIGWLEHDSRTCPTCRAAIPGLPIVTIMQDEHIDMPIAPPVDPYSPMFSIGLFMAISVLDVLAGLIGWIGWIWPVYMLIVSSGLFYGFGSVVFCFVIAYGYHSGKIRRQSNLNVACYILYMLSVMGVIAYWLWRLIIQPPIPTTGYPTSYNDVFWLGVCVNVAPIVCLLPMVIYDCKKHF